MWMRYGMHWGVLDQPIIWIAGGIDKGNDYDQIVGLVPEKVKCLISLGIDNEKLDRYFSGKIADIAKLTAYLKPWKWLFRGRNQGTSFYFPRHVPVSISLKIMKSVVNGSGKPRWH